MPNIDISNRYIKIRVRDPNHFVENSLYSIWIDKNNGIQEVVGTAKDTKKADIQSYVFDKEKHTIESAKEWLKNKKTTKAEHLIANKLFITSKASICSSVPKRNPDTNRIEPIVAYEDDFPKLNDKYYFYVPGVHEGFNNNDAYFYKDEILNSYHTMRNTPYDWEHQGDQLIGTTTDVELITYPEKPIAIGISAVLWRLSPYMQMEEEIDGALKTRDELVKERYLGGQLASSMECYFDKIKCTSCGYTTTDWLDFEFHKMMNHYVEIEAGERVGMGILGPKFVGNGIVKYPADEEAYVVSLRTSDDNTLRDIWEDSELREQFGSMSVNLEFAKLVAFAQPTDTMLYNSGRLVFASELFNKDVNNSPKKDDKSYITNRDSDLIGGTTMIDFAKIFAESSNLKEAFDKVIAQVKELNKEEADWDAIMASFTAEAIKFVENQTKAEVDVAVQAKETELTEKMNSNKDGFDTKISELSATVETLKAEKAALETELKAKNDKISELENQTKEAEVSAKVGEIMAEFKNSGVEFDETFSASIKDQVRTKIEAGDEDALKLFKTSVLTTFKQSKLIEASLNNGGVTPGVNDAPKSLQQELEEARNKVKNKQ